MISVFKYILDLRYLLPFTIALIILVNTISESEGIISGILSVLFFALLAAIIRWGFRKLTSFVFPKYFLKGDSFKDTFKYMLIFSCIIFDIIFLFGLYFEIFD
mgnify:CR=1 FL=1